jgi:uncharacterized delta-60 repeat protein
LLAANGDEDALGVYAIAAASDGSGDVYVGGRFSAYSGAPVNNVARLNADGTLDAAFAPGPAFGAALAFVVRKIVPAADNSGDIYVLRNLIGVTGETSQLFRLNADGSPDAGFATGTGFGTQPAYDVIPAGDGSGDLMVVGNFAVYNGTAVSRAVRLNADGTIDAAFAAPVISQAIRSIAPAGDASGDMYIGGDFQNVGGQVRFRVARLNANGTLDPDFAMLFGFDARVERIATGANGTVWAGGWFTLYDGAAAGGIACLGPTGQLTSTAGFSSRVYHVAPAGDGSGDVHVGGTFGSFNGAAANGLCRLNADATMDVAFQTGGALDMVPYFPAALNGVEALRPAVDGSGDVYVGGDFFAHSGASKNGLVRLNANGTRDDAFNVGTGVGNVVGPVVQSIHVAPDGDVYVGGAFVQYNGVTTNGLVRLNPNGTPDAAFTTPNAPLDVRAIIPVGPGTPDLYVGAQTGVFRMTPGGAVSPAFAPVVFSAEAIAVATDGSNDLWIGGSVGLLRANADGSIDNAFLATDAFVAAPSSLDRLVMAILPAGDGSGDMYVAGRFAQYYAVPVNPLIRLNADGSLDPGFTAAAFQQAGDPVVVRDLAPGGGGDIYAAGQFSGYGGAPSNRLVRLNADGALDAAFNVGAGFSGPVHVLAAAPGGDLYVGGTFWHYNNTTAIGVIRLNDTGGVD